MFISRSGVKWFHSNDIGFWFLNNCDYIEHSFKCQNCFSFELNVCMKLITWCLKENFVTWLARVSSTIVKFATSLIQRCRVYQTNGAFRLNAQPTIQEPSWDGNEFNCRINGNTKWVFCWLDPNKFTSFLHLINSSWHDGNGENSARYCFVIYCDNEVETIGRFHLRTPEIMV